VQQGPETGQDGRNMAVKKDSCGRITVTEQLSQDSQERTSGTGQPGQIGPTGQPVQVSLYRFKTTGMPDFPASGQAVPE
jgi:hypothetical protein